MSNQESGKFVSHGLTGSIHDIKSVLPWHHWPTALTGTFGLLSNSRHAVGDDSLLRGQIANQLLFFFFAGPIFRHFFFFSSHDSFMFLGEHGSVISFSFNCSRKVCS